MSVNKVILVGRLGQNPEVRYTPSGAAVANLNLATNEAWVDKNQQKQERTEWHRVVVWGKQAEHCAQYLSKGRQVYVEGRLQTRKWQDQAGQTKYSTEVQATTVQFLGGGAGAGAGAGGGGGLGSSEGGPGANYPGAQGGSEGGGHEAGAPSFTEEDIPF